MPKNPKSLTLLELLICLVLLSIVVVAIAGLNIFSFFQVTASDRRATIQQEAYLVLEHMNKEISKAIGNEAVDNLNGVVNINDISSDKAIRVFVDSDLIDVNGNYPPGDGKRSSVPPDRWIGYRFTDTHGNDHHYEVQFCPKCTNAPCTTCDPAWGTEENIISKRVVAFTPIKSPDSFSSLNMNYVGIEVTVCWDPAANPRGTPENPCLPVNSGIRMPSVSTN